jgi:tetratricopeptide (TPR) repeat protein
MGPLPCLSEDTIAAFVEGRLEPSAMSEVEIHASLCSNCQDLLAVALRSATLMEPPLPAEDDGSDANRAPERAPLVRGSFIGRYTILELRGRGGMGEVYAAYDAEMDRKVALKVLHARGAASQADADARLLREARALARLSHPNVVAVHDAGTIEGRVFIAMEYVEGVTLKEWLGARPRSREEIIATFVMAARGLAAAHAAGLVHRDFKPQNVMIAADGTARVLDFGLVAPLGEATDGAGAQGTDTDGAADGPLHLTRTGQRLGTPLYMAPEQFRGAAADARADQFSFCVALHQALYGALPFGASALGALVAEVRAGRVRPAPADSNVPTWLRRVVLRGLAVAPASRWPSMNALVAALEHDPGRARRRWGLAAGVLGLAALAAVTQARRARRPPSFCQGGASRLADVWPAEGGGSPRRETARRAFLASGVPTAGETWERVAPLLDRYAAGWLAMYGDACQATHMRHAQPTAVLDLRMTCLEQRRTALAALTDLFMTADRGAIAKAVDAANALPLLDPCADIAQLLAPIPPPRDRATAARVDDVRKRAAVAKALNDTGKHLEAVRRIEPLVGEARALGYQPLLAELLHGRMTFQDGSNFSPEVISFGEEAVWVGVASGRDDLAASAAVTLVALVGYYHARREEGWRWSSMAHGLLARVRGNHDLLDAWLLENEGIMLGRENRPRLALDRVNESVALKQKMLGPNHPDVGRGLNSVAEAWHRLGNDAEAVKINAEALRIFAKAYGRSGSETCMALSNRGEYMVGLGQADDSVPILEEATTCWEAQVGREHQFIAYPLTALGRALLASRHPRPAEAARVLERALRIREAKEPDAALVGETRGALERARGAGRRAEPSTQGEGSRGAP